MRPPLLARVVPALALLFASPLLAAEIGFSLKEKPGEVLDVLRDGKVLARYMLAHDRSTPARQNETYKPYLHVFDATGQAPITKGAGGAFTHHRGIFIGWNKVTLGTQKFDRWHMKGGDQVHEKFLERKVDAAGATFTSLVRWEGAKPEETLLEEERTLRFLPAPAPAYALIEMRSRLKAVAGETILDGDVEHAGLHFRPADEIDRTKTAYLYPVQNAEPKKDRDYRWFGESFTIPAGRFSVVYLSHPENPQEAATSAYRDYGRFGTFWKKTIPAGGTAEFKVRFLIFAGELPPADFIQAQWNQFAGRQEPVPQTTAKAAETNKPAPPKKPAPSAQASPTLVAPLAAKAPKPATAAPAAAESQPTSPPARQPATVPGDASATTMVLSEDPAIRAAQSAKRAGGGPENPELHFRPPAPAVLSPEEQMKTFKVAPGFQVQLVAAEPLVETPVAVSWDAQGRMYVCEMRGYMHDVDATGEDQPIGRITRLEDTDGDGRMDTRTVFVDQLVMPRAVMALGDGAIVSEPPVLAWYRDTNGDGVADKKEVVAENYAKKDGQPEHMANSPMWTMDNWITSTKHDVRYRFKGGQFASETTTPSGQWGRTQDDWGRQYYNTNSDLLRTDLFAPAYYVRNPLLPDRTGLGFQVMRDQTCWPSHPTPG